MDPAIEAARALLPSWVQWANLAMLVPIAFATTLFATLLAIAVATRRGDLAPALRAGTLFVLLLPLLWFVIALSAAGPISRAPAWLLALSTTVASLAAALITHTITRRAARRVNVALRGRSDRHTLRALVVGVTLCAGIAVALRGFAGQAWSRDRETRVFAVAFTGGHDRTLADLAWITAQRGDQRGAAVLLQAALIAEASAVPAANLAIVFVNEGRCTDAGDALREARRRIAGGGSERERHLLRLAMDALRSCEGRDGMQPITGGS